MTERQKNAIKMENELFAVTERMLQENSFEELTTRNLCKEAGISYGSFYNRFPSKGSFLYEYAKRLFADMLLQNPRPDTMEEGDFIKRIAWSLSLYGRFCQGLGRDFVRYIYENNANDVFYELCFDGLVVSELYRGLRMGYLNLQEKYIYRLCEDVEIVYKGIVRQWSSMTENEMQKSAWSQGYSNAWWNMNQMEVPGKLPEKMFGLENILRRIPYRLIFSFATEEYKNTFRYGVEYSFDN